MHRKHLGIQCKRVGKSRSKARLPLSWLYNAVACRALNETAVQSHGDVSLRYEYDDHYFLTDPREFIYEFFPLQEDWQLLKQPISLKDFEELPFVRSLFFRWARHVSPHFSWNTKETREMGFYTNIRIVGRDQTAVKTEVEVTWLSLVKLLSNYIAMIKMNGDYALAR